MAEVIYQENTRHKHILRAIIRSSPEEMSWLRSNKNGVHGHNTYNNPKSAELGHVHRPVIVDHNGVEHPIVGYESHNSERYMARSSRTEAVVTYRRFPGMADEEYTIPKITEDLSGRKNEFSPKSHDERVRRPIKDSPWDSGVRFHSPPSKEHHQYYDDDDVRVNHSKGTRPNNMKEQEYHDHDENNRRNGGFTRQGSPSNYLNDQEYEHENPMTNGYTPPKYSVPISTHRVIEKGNDYDTRGRMAPFGTPPRNETSYETSKFKPNANSPQRFNPQPKIEQGNNHQETIDSTEARKRYGNGAPGAGAGPYAKDDYSGGTIDSREAARRYNGVLLTN